MLSHRNIRASKMPKQSTQTTTRTLNEKRPKSMMRNTKRRSTKCVIALFAGVACWLTTFNLWWHLNLNPLSGPSSNLSHNQKLPTNHACDGYRGIYHVEKGDIGGAAGTVFFQFVIGQIIWAEKYNFKPWVFLNNVSYVIYDPIHHGQGPGVDFTMQRGMNISYIHRPNGHWRDAIPGPPENVKNLKPTHFHFDGNGVWEDYFEPVSDFVPGDLSCRDKALVTMDLYLVTPGVHGFAPWAPRCWRYQYLPDYVTKPHVPLLEWLEPQRHLAHKALTKYIKFLPFIHEKAGKINPGCSLENSCLGIHIRQSDKAAGRRQIQTDEFLPYVEAFVEAGGKWVYLATDSGKAMEHIRTEWPGYLQKIIRSMGNDVVRSNDESAVFDIASHHRTNTEIMIEILALSKCQFMIHGLSAVTETSIWINVDLHYTSVNLEDPDFPDPKTFGERVKNVLGGENATKVLLEERTTDWWKVADPTLKTTSLDQTHEACSGVEGILHISHVGVKVTAGTAFFASILNQLLYADRYNLKPWIHLGNESEYLYDEEIHGLGPGVLIEGMDDRFETSKLRNEYNASFFFPGKPEPNKPASGKPLRLEGSGIWGNYFEPVSDFVPGDKSCKGKPIVSMSTEMVMPGLYSWTPWSIKPWRNDNIPDDLWKPENMTLKTFYEPMRLKAHELVSKYFKFHPFIEQRAQDVNPVNATSPPCLAVHFRNSDKGKNKYRSKFPVNKFRDYITAFVRAGGQVIYIATDSHRVLEFIDQHFPWQIRKIIRTQGPYVVRSTKKWPIHFLEKHHRTNSEVLVDILAMSKCQILLHGHSAVSEAALYLNIGLHNQSVNWEDPDRISVDEFEVMSKRILRTTDSAPVLLNPSLTEKQVTATEIGDQPVNVTILKGQHDHLCKKNAIVYLAQKKHSSYDRDSYGILLESLDRMYKNYLSLNNHQNNTDVIIFHTADFDEKDLQVFETRFGKDFRNLVHLVDLSNTPYWKRPKWHEMDDPTNWYAYPLFSEGYRRMMHWFAIDIWQFFLDHGKSTGCQYEYIMRFDEDSFLHSPISYDIFNFMKSRDYHYGFRLCSYEMQVTQRIWKLWRKSKNSPNPVRDIELEMCGVYNNFFVAKIDFFRSDKVQQFLRFVDRQGMIYRRRLGDLMIHSMAIYGFADPAKIHRFLDFTYEHSTIDKKSGCVIWGGIQAGYDDPDSDATIDAYYKNKVSDKGCQANLTLMSKGSLSPTYSHLPDRLNGKVALKTITAGRVELPGRGILSG